MLREFHERRGGRFTTLNGAEVVADYGDVAAEYTALRESAALLDLSARGWLCVTGADRARFLHGQVTNDVSGLRPGRGCYAALITAKGKMQSDLNIYCLPEELLLDFEPGLTASVSERLEKYIIADDAQITDAAPHYGMLSVQGPKAEAVARGTGLSGEVPAAEFGFVVINDAALGEIYLMNRARAGTRGLDWFVPASALGAVAERLLAAVESAGGRVCGWQALELARIEAGIPRFGADMDETNLPLEAGLEGRAVNFTKGCYIGQEVMSRVHNLGQVAKALRRLRLAGDLKELPVKGDKLMLSGKEVGHITSAAALPGAKGNVALGYVRKEVNQVGTGLVLRTGSGES